jgi:phage tail sheath protein FI
VEYETTFGQREILNPASVNCLVDTPQTGRAVWGARTLSLDSTWLYIQVRRLFMFVEKSTFLSTHWAIFENNGPELWSRIRMSLNGFLLNLHNDGYFAGTTPETSYRVVCDATNNPQSAIDTGLLTCDVWLAPNKPAEFLRFRFQQIVATS